MKPIYHSYSSLTLYKNCPYNFYRQKIVGDIKPVFRKAADDGIKVHKSIESRLKDKMPLPEQIASLEPTCAAIESYDGEVLVEQAISINEKLEPCDRWSNDRWLTSIIDLMVKDKSRAFVLDWKTGNYWKDNFQMLIATNNIFCTMPEIDSVLTSVRWLKTGQEDKQNFKRSQGKFIFSEIKSVVHKIETSVETEEWKCRKSGLCSYCPTKPECPLYKK